MICINNTVVYEILRLEKEYLNLCVITQYYIPIMASNRGVLCFGYGVRLGVKSRLLYRAI